jgi:ABC-type transporter Mla subunit MlaD
LLFALAVIACSDKNKNRITILFDRVDNIEVGSNVYLKGFLVGEVKHLALADNGVWVDIKLAGETKIPVDSKFLVISSPLGLAHISIEASDKKNYLLSKDTVTGVYNQQGLLDELLADSTNKEKVYRFLDELNERLKEMIKKAKDSTKESDR